MTNSATRQQLLEFLCEHQVITLAVAGPYAAAVFYVVDADLNLYFVTDPTTRHGTELTKDGRVAGTVQRDRQQRKEIRGVQLTGHCRRLTGRAWVTGWTLYLKKFAWAASPELMPAVAKVALWEIKPDWMRLIDNRQGFGHKEEWRRLR